MEEEKKDQIKENITNTVVDTSKAHTEEAVKNLKEKIENETSISKKVLYGAILAVIFGIGTVVSSYGASIIDYIFNLF